MMDVDEWSFQREVLQSEGLILAVFTANYCPFCRSFLPIFEEYSKRYSGLKFAKVDVTDDDSPLWDSCRLEVVPTLIAFKGGCEIGRRDGVRGVGLSERDLQSFIAELRGQGHL